MIEIYTVFSFVLNVVSPVCWLVLAVLTGIFARGSSRLLLCAALVLRALMSLPVLAISFGTRFSQSVGRVLTTVGDVALWLELLFVALAALLDGRRRQVTA